MSTDLPTKCGGAVWSTETVFNQGRENRAALFGVITPAVVRGRTGEYTRSKETSWKMTMTSGHKEKGLADGGGSFCQHS